MDGQRFDELARGLATGVGRRSLLRAALGGALASFAGARLAAAQDEGAAEADRPGDGDGSGNGNGNGNGCPDGCPDGQRCADGACREVSCREDKECRDRADACIGGRCEDGQCVQFIVDCRPGFLCCGNGECCPQPCRTSIDCFVPNPCEVGQCVDGACAFEAKDGCVTCGVDADCADLAGAAFCCEGVCTSPCPDGTTLGKGCECVVGSIDDLDANGVSESDDASGNDGADEPAADEAPDDAAPVAGEAESAENGTITLGGPITISTSDAPESTIVTAEPDAAAADDAAVTDDAAAGETSGADGAEAAEAAPAG